MRGNYIVEQVGYTIRDKLDRILRNGSVDALISFDVANLLKDEYIRDLQYEVDRRLGLEIAKARLDELLGLHNNSQPDRRLLSRMNELESRIRDLERQSD